METFHVVFFSPSTDGNGRQWTSMDVNERQWTAMDVHGRQWPAGRPAGRSMDVNGWQWMSMDVNGHSTLTNKVSIKSHLTWAMYSGTKRRYPGGKFCKRLWSCGWSSTATTFPSLSFTRPLRGDRTSDSLNHMPTCASSMPQSLQVL